MISFAKFVPFNYYRVLVELAQLQDEEVGDGTTSVVILAAELLKVGANCKFATLAPQITTTI